MATYQVSDLDYNGEIDSETNKTNTAIYRMMATSSSLPSRTEDDAPVSPMQCPYSTASS